MSDKPADITESAMFRQAAIKARVESKRYWAGRPKHEEARFWPLPKPRDPHGILFLNARGVRVLHAILELLEFHDIEAVKSLIFREITRVSE